MTGQNEHVDCPICKARGPGHCMKLCDGSGRINLEALARTLADEQRAEVEAETGRKPADSFTSQRLHFLEMARQYVTTLNEIWNKPK